MIDVADSNAVYYYHFDGLGSVAALSDVNNMVVESYSYDVFGAPTVYDANYSEISKSAIGNPYMFTARRADDETALYYYRARYYAFDIGRFLQADPIGYADSLNFYTYCGNNPLNWLDPFGFCKEKKVRRKTLSDHWGDFWEDVGEWCDAIEYCLEYATNLNKRKLNDKYKHMEVSYELTKKAGPTKTTIIGIVNEAVDMIFGEGFNIGDVMADILGTEEAQSGTPEGDALELFQNAAPVINDRYDIKIKVIPVPWVGTYWYVYWD